MFKKILLVFFFSQSFIKADQGLTQLSVNKQFGFNQAEIITAKKEAQWAVNSTCAKKYASRAFFAAALGLYAYRVFSKNVPENCVLVQISPPINQGLFAWATQKVVDGGGKIIEGIATQSLVSLFFSVLPKYNITCDTQWFFNKQTQIKVLIDALTEDFAQLPFLQEQGKIEYQIAMITHKLELLTKDLIRLFGFFRYSQEQKERVATFNAVCMLSVIKNSEQITQATLESLQTQLHAYQTLPSDMEQKTEKAASLKALFIKYVQSLFTDLKTFTIYEKN